ncbi:MAG: 16S rRNA (guanine(966)-N(2))-methyltransferase RsmD [candidate division NC10 bacterium]|nr:16S rRNA (guanine(966)-N(2))-methyltransferase RsmD [candidate division NC10 bacterium]
MRISAGEHRGRRLRGVNGTRTRPTSDLLRQALFNVLGARIHGARVLDLFAGTGAVGLDALSRGAARATFVELDRKALARLRANLAALNLLPQARVLAGDVLPALSRLQAAGETFDCIFVDPPYTGDLAGRCIEILADGALLSDNGALVVQGFHKTALPERVGVLGRTWGRRYGESRLTLYSKETACR